MAECFREREFKKYIFVWWKICCLVWKYSVGSVYQKQKGNDVENIGLKEVGNLFEDWNNVSLCKYDFKFYKQFFFVSYRTRLLSSCLLDIQKLHSANN